MMTRLDTHLAMLLLLLPLFAFGSTLFIACDATVDDTTSPGGSALAPYGYGND
jgi:hypothetical protein